MVVSLLLLLLLLVRCRAYGISHAAVSVTQRTSWYAVIDTCRCHGDRKVAARKPSKCDVTE